MLIVKNKFSEEWMKPVILDKPIRALKKIKIDKQLFCSQGHPLIPTTNPCDRHGCDICGNYMYD